MRLKIRLCQECFLSLRSWMLLEKVHPHIRTSAHLTGCFTVYIAPDPPKGVSLTNTITMMSLAVGTEPEAQ